MFFESLFFARILIKSDQNPANYVKEITVTTAIRDVQNGASQFHKSSA
jgi:hypothetical protein